MKNFEVINAPITLLALLVSSDATSYVEYKQKIDNTWLRLSKEELLKKSLADLIALANNKVYFRITKL